MSKKQPTKASGSSTVGKSNHTPSPTTSKQVTKKSPSTAAASQSDSTATTMTSSNNQNFILIWLDSNIDMSSDDCKSSIARMRSVVSTLHVFNDADQCVHFLKEMKKDKVLMVVSGSFGQRTVRDVHNMPQLTAIFVFCGDKPKHELWSKDWSKVKGVFTDITGLCESLKQATGKDDDDSIEISFIPAGDLSKQNLDELDQSFMYTQLIKEILLELESDDQSVTKLVTYCQGRYSGNEAEMENISKIENEYHLKTPIWWYTYECCIYQLVNWALRKQEADVLIKMAFFIRDLHRHIENLHLEQSKDYQKEFIVFRGQSMPQAKFEKLENTKGGLISFNNFLSTSMNRKVGMKFAIKDINNPSVMCILFIMNVDPSVSSAPFACIDNISHYPGESEILFSMHTVFRIGKIEQSDKYDRLRHVYLTLTKDGDQQLNTLSERIREEIQGSTPLYRLGALMVKLGEFNKAEEVFETLRGGTRDELELANIYYQLGHVNDNQSNYDKALTFYQQALTNYNRTLGPNHPNTATCYNNIGLVHDNKNDYPTALSFYEKALKIYLSTLLPDSPILAACYNNIGSVYDNMKEYPKALEYYDKSLKIYSDTFPSNHPNVATSYNSIGLVYNNMREYSKALEYCKIGLEKLKKSVPSNHPLLATSFNNIGMVYDNMKQYAEAISSYEHAVKIGKVTLPPYHPNLKVYINNLELAQKKRNK